MRNACESHGNFRALLQFHIFAGDSVLQHHLSNAPRNSTYTSPDISNQVIDILSDYIRRLIFLRVKKAKLFTLVADEVTDSSNKEQLSLVLRYVNTDDCCIREDLATFLIVALLDKLLLT